MKLSFNQNLMDREVDQCFFDHDAFVAYFSNEVGYKILAFVKKVGVVDESWLVGLTDEPEKVQAILSFVDSCIRHKILISQED